MKERFRRRHSSLLATETDLGWKDRNKPFCAMKAYQGNISWPWKNASSLQWPLWTFWNVILWYCRRAVKNSGSGWRHWNSLAGFLSNQILDHSSQPRRQKQSSCTQNTHQHKHPEKYSINHHGDIFPVFSYLVRRKKLLILYFTLYHPITTSRIFNGWLISVWKGSVLPVTFYFCRKNL